MEVPKYYYDETHLRDHGVPDREGRDKLLAEMLRQRQGGMFAGHHPGLGAMGIHQLPLPRAHPMGPMMGGYPRHGFPPPIGMGMGMGMGAGTGMGDRGMAMGIHPHIGMAGLGTGPGRPMFDHPPFGHQQRSPFSYGSPGPPRAHSFFPQPQHPQSPFSRPRQRPFSSSQMIFDEDQLDDDYHMPPRRGFGRQKRSGFRFVPRYASRRRSYQPSMFEESEDDYDDYDGYEDDYDGEDEFEEYFPRRSSYMRLQRGY
jgi:hypothetical protein